MIFNIPQIKRHRQLLRQSQLLAGRVSARGHVGQTDLGHEMAVDRTGNASVQPLDLWYGLPLIGAKSMSDDCSRPILAFPFQRHG
jgi:hypothetical protein